MSYTAQSATVQAGGATYNVGDILTVVGGTFTSQAQFQVTAVAAGVVTAVILFNVGLYSSLPGNPASTTGGTGAGCTLIVTWTSLVPSGPPSLRTTPGLVAGIVQVQAGFDVTPFIYAANNLTTNACTYPLLGTNPNDFPPYTDGFVDSQMELIERWLSAHFYSIYSNQLTNAKAGTVQVGFQYKIDLGLKVTMYGQMAMMLDVYGNLAAISNTQNIKRKIKVSILAMGRENRWPGCVADWADLTVDQ